VGAYHENLQPKLILISLLKTLIGCHQSLKTEKIESASRPLRGFWMVDNQ
jgi:hypothetical protein